MGEWFSRLEQSTFSLRTGACEAKHRSTQLAESLQLSTGNRTSNRTPQTFNDTHPHIVCICLMWLKPEPQPEAQIHETCCIARAGYWEQGARQDKAGRRLPEPCREGSHRPRMIFVSIVARSCRRPFQRWNLDRKGSLSGGIPSSTNDLRFHRGPIMSVAIPAVESRPAGDLVGRDSIVHE